MVSQTCTYLSHVDFGNQHGHSGNNQLNVSHQELRNQCVTHIYTMCVLLPIDKNYRNLLTKTEAHPP